MNAVDWSRSFLEPVRFEMTENSLKLAAGGQEILFEGSLLSLLPDCARGTVSANRAEEADLLTLRARPDILHDGEIRRITWFDGVWSGFDEMLVHGTAHSSICMFLRRAEISFFLSLDFPYSRIEDGGISYDPCDTVRRGESYEIYPLTVGAVRLTGVKPDSNGAPGRFDRAEIEGMSEYVESKMPKRFRRPIFSTTCITNRMTDVRDGHIFYSMHDNPTVHLDPATLFREIELCAELGVEYYQVFEGYFDFPAPEADSRQMAALTAYGRERGVRVGGYLTPGGPYCPHYYYEPRSLERPDWLRLRADGERDGRHCLGSDEYVRYIAQTMCEAARRNGDRMICLDMWNIVPCFDPEHGHGPGSIFAEVRGLIRLMQALAETGPDFLVWSNAGDFGMIAPKIVWYNPNVYLSDPHARRYTSSLNLLKYYGDCRREQMVTLHNLHFLPYACYTNCEYYVFRHSRVDDMAFFEYSLLQGLCVTPNVCFGELRTFFERIPASRVQYCKDFIKKWLNFIRDNYEVWRHTFQVGGEPGQGQREIYAHIRRDRGFLCLINQSHLAQSFSFTLDGTVGLSERGGFLLTEEYPTSAPLAEQKLPFAAYGETVALEVPGYGIRIIRVSPELSPEKGARLYGLEAEFHAVPGGFQAEISGESGREYELAAVTGPGYAIREITAETVKSVPLYTFPAAVSNLRAAGPAARFSLTMPHDCFQRELAEWRIDGDAPRPLDPAASGFQGAYLHNLYTERQKVRLMVRTEPEEGNPAAPPPVPGKRRDYGAPRGRVYETELDIPFIEYSFAALCYGHDAVLELVFSDPEMVSAVRLTLDGTPCESYRFYYPARSMYVYCVELTGIVSSGTRPALRVEIDWAETAERAAPESADGPAKAVQVLGQ